MGRKGEGDYLSQRESGNVMLHLLPGDAKRSSEGGEARKSMKNSFLAFFFLGLLFASVLSVLTACTCILNSTKWRMGWGGVHAYCQ